MKGDVFTAAGDWQALHDLPVGTVLIDPDGHAYQIGRSDREPGRTTLHAAGSEEDMEVTVEPFMSWGEARRFDREMPDSLVEVWRPSDGRG